MSVVEMNHLKLLRFLDLLGLERAGRYHLPALSPEKSTLSNLYPSGIPSTAGKSSNCLLHFCLRGLVEFAYSTQAAGVSASLSVPPLLGVQPYSSPEPKVIWACASGVYLQGHLFSDPRLLSTPCSVPLSPDGRLGWQEGLGSA